MTLERYPVSAQIAVSDIDRAQEFYEGKLGLVPSGPQHEGVLLYACGDGTLLNVYATVPHAGTASGTVAYWKVADLTAVMEELTRAGVTFEHYDEPVRTDEAGVHDSGYGQIAWFKDPDGNTFALECPNA